MKDQKALDRLYAIIDDTAEGRYKDLYRMLGETQSKNGNFHCWNSAAHSDGEDSNASLSVDNNTGKYLCHGCQKKGNLATYYKEFIANSPNDKWDGSYTKMMADVLGLKNYLPSEGEEDEELLKQASDVVKAFTIKKETVKTSEPKKAISYISQDQNDVFVNTLLEMNDAKEYLFNNRFIKEDTIIKYRIGFNKEKQCFTFPMIDANGNIVNIKMYRPWNLQYKWQAMIKGNPLIPAPVVHLTHSKLYIFEGEPDCYCAAAHGLYGITSGGVSQYSYKKIYGDQFEAKFRNKEIVLVMDADDKGIAAATKIAEELYPIVKQIKIVDLNKSNINPNGLDPKAVKNVGGKMKRSEKDFTDFMIKNKFGEDALRSFNQLVDATEVYTQNITRSKVENYKVTLVESVKNKYYDKDSCKRLEITARVHEYDEKVYKYPTKVCVACKPLYDLNMKTGRCKTCVLSTIHGFGDMSTKSVTYNLIRNSSINPSVAIGKLDIPIEDKIILSMIQTTEEQLEKIKKKHIGIPKSCDEVKISDVELETIQSVTLTKDPDECIDDEVKAINDKRSMREKSSLNESDGLIQAFFISDSIVGNERIKVNKSYRFKAIHVTMPHKQSCVLFCFDIKQTQDGYEQFRMGDEINETLSVFKPKGSIADHLNEKYAMFGSAAGINGRDDLFFLADLAYFSTINMVNEQVLPSVKRGWVEVLIAGDSRCGKSIVGEFLLDHYRVGAFVGSSEGISRTGLVGGVALSFGAPKIQWGVFPKNDKGIVIIDELSKLDYNGLSSITDLRSSGIAQIEKIKSGQVNARARKIFFSNWRNWRDEDVDRSANGIENIRKLCYEDPILTRFDVATVVRATDVSTEKFNCKYEKITTKFTSLQCQTLLYWAYSRTLDQIKFENTIGDALNEGQKKMLSIFHSGTQLVNQEMRAKLCRMAISLASMTYSTFPDDYNCIYVRKEHVEYMVNFLIRLYSHKNMGMIEFTDEKRRSEQLGDMKFMMNILEYIDIESIIEFKEGNEKDLCTVFADYLIKVSEGSLYIVEASCNKVSTRQRNYSLDSKFIGILRARKCFVKSSKGSYRKTEAFTEWLKKRRAQGDSAETSNILELKPAQQNPRFEFISGDFIKSAKSKETASNN